MLVYSVKACAVFAAIMIVALVRLRDHHPFPRFGPANLVTTLRAALLALVAACIGEPAGDSTAGTVVVAATLATALDGVDGWLARRTRMASAFGARFDMEVDALLILVLAILAWRWNKAGVWVLASGLMRYAFVAASGPWPWLGRPLEASVRGKVICVVQIASLILVLLPDIAPPASTAIAAVGLVVLSYSFLVDTVWLWQHR